MDRKKPNYKAHFIMGVALMFGIVYSTFSTGGERANGEEF